MSLTGNKPVGMANPGPGTVPWTYSQMAPGFLRLPRHLRRKNQGKPRENQGKSGETPTFTFIYGMFSEMYGKCRQV